jgi:hypothetical protein
MKPLEVMDDSSESGKKKQRPSRILSSLRRNVNVFRSASGTGQDEMRPFLSGGATASTSGATGDLHPHGHALPHAKGNFEIYSVRDRRDATAKRAFKVQVPKRMLYYTMTVFLVLPLALFLWKEMHLDNHDQYPATHDLVKSNMRGAHGTGHDFYPTWMEETIGSTVWNDPPANVVTTDTTATNDTFAILETTTDQPHNNIASSGAFSEKLDDNSNSTSGLPDDMVVTDTPGDSFSVLGSSTTKTNAVTGIESNHAKKQKSDSVESTAELAHAADPDGFAGANDGGAGAHDTTPGDGGAGTSTKLSSELADDPLGTGLYSLAKERPGMLNKPSKDDDNVRT